MPECDLLLGRCNGWEFCSSLNRIDRTIEIFGAIHVAINCEGARTPEKVLGKKGVMRMDNCNRTVQFILIGTMNVILLSAEKMVRNAPNSDGEGKVIQPNP